MSDSPPRKRPHWPTANGQFDPEEVNRIVGKRLLVSLTYIRHSGEVIEKKQVHGIVEEISNENGVVIRMNDGSTLRLPPNLSSLEEAPPGIYRLRQTGEEVEDPDFLSIWTITRPDA